MIAMVRQFQIWLDAGLRWLLLALAFLMLLGVILRSTFGMSFTILDESFTYLHATVILLATAPTLLFDGHVRVDIFYSKITAQKKRLVNIFGNALLGLPPMALIAYHAGPFFLRSWRIKEGSAELDGIQAVYVLKGLILVCAVMMILQLLANILVELGGSKHQTPAKEQQ